MKVRLVASSGDKPLPMAQYNTVLRNWAADISSLEELVLLVHDVR